MVGGGRSNYSVVDDVGILQAWCDIAEPLLRLLEQLFIGKQGCNSNIFFRGEKSLFPA